MANLGVDVPRWQGAVTRSYSEPGMILSGKELQQSKRELANLALDGSGRAAGLTRDDLLDLLR